MFGTVLVLGGFECLCVVLGDAIDRAVCNCAYFFRCALIERCAVSRANTVH